MCWSSAWSVLLCLHSREHPERMTLLRTFGPAVKRPIDDLQGTKSARAATCNRLVISPRAPWHMLWALNQEFCGACHRSANTVGMMPDLGGISNVRFQPYRLASSRAHDSNDPRFACTTCHDPHLDLPEQEASADSRCSGCHAARALGGTAEKTTSSKVSAKSCPVSKTGCIGCHMPKVELPGTHFKFTDHRIRIARPAEKYPF